MFFQHVYEKGLAQGSYVIGCQSTGEAIVIDPKRDIDTYLEIAKKNRLTITHITETHIHADFLSGARELAAATGAKMYLSDEGGEGWLYEFDHVGLKDGDEIKVGNLIFKVMHTPGHTPESLTFILTDTRAADKPVMAFTGDFVFVGDVGRPDLAEKSVGISGASQEGAQQMYQSIQRLNAIPDYIQIWPAHGAGSACGKALGAVPSSTLGYERIQNWAFQFGNNKEEFINELLADQPEPPKYFAMMKKYNKEKRPVLSALPKPKKLMEPEFIEAYKKGMKIIDTRSKNDVLEHGFLANTYTIGDGGSFSTWAGWYVDFNEPFILIADEGQLDELTRKLVRIGLDNIYGYMPKDISFMLTDPTKPIAVNAEEVKTKLNDAAVQIIDVRGETDYKTSHIAGSDHVFVGTLENHLDKIDKNKEVIVSCQSGYRSTIAYSLLIKNGFTNVKNYLGGMDDWLKHDYPVEASIANTVS